MKGMNHSTYASGETHTKIPSSVILVIKVHNKVINMVLSFALVDVLNLMHIKQIYNICSKLIRCLPYFD